MRNPFYDIVKGIAISLVVLGHVLQSFCPDCQNNILYLAIYSFHMPLFISISGYFFLKSVEKKTVLEFIKSKFQHLMLPSLTMGIIDCLMIGGGKVLKCSDWDWLYFVGLFLTGLWFLTVLFILSVVGCLLYKYFKKYMYHGWLILILLLYFCPGIYVINEVKYLAPFFVASLSLSRYDWSTLSWKIGIPSIVVFASMLLVYNFDMSMYKMTDEVFTMQYLLYFIIRIIIGFAGIVTLLYLTIYFKKISFKSASVFVYLGSVTLPIYALHQKFLLFNLFLHTSISNYIVLIVITIAILYINVLLYKLLKQNSVLNLLMFGDQ